MSDISGLSARPELAAASNFGDHVTAHHVQPVCLRLEHPQQHQWDAFGDRHECYAERQWPELAAAFSVAS